MGDSRVRQFTTLLSRAAARDLPPEELLQACVDAVTRAMQTNVATLYLYDSAANELVLAATRGLARSGVGFVTLAPGQGVSGRAAAERAPIVTPDVLLDPGFAIIPAFDQSRYRSMLAVPVLLDGRLLGTLNVQTTEVREYTPGEVLSLQAIALHLARLLDRMLQNNLTFQLRGPSVLSKLEGAVRAPRDPAQVCQNLVSEVHALLPGYRCTVSLHRPDGGEELVGDAPAPNAVGLGRACLAEGTRLQRVDGEWDTVAFPLVRGERSLQAAFLVSRHTRTRTQDFDSFALHYLDAIVQQFGRVLEQLPPADAGGAMDSDTPSVEARVQDILTAMVLQESGLEAIVRRAGDLVHARLAVVDSVGVVHAGSLMEPEAARIPLVAGGEVVAHLVCEDGETPRTLLTAIAQAVSLELAKLKLRFDLESQLRGDILDMLVNLEAEPDSDTVRRAGLAGIDLARPYAPIVLLFDVAAFARDSGSLARQSILRALQRAIGMPPQAVAFMRAEGLTILCATGPGDTAMTVAAEALGTIRRLAPHHPSQAGVGPVCQQISTLGTSVRQATIAAEFGRTLAAPAPVHASRLGAFQLLTAVSQPGALQDFVHTYLGPLIERDEQSGTDLVKTLEAFHAHRERLQPASAALYVHVNTLKYRLARIEELTRRSLNNPLDRLNLYLALYAYRLLAPDRASLLPNDALGSA